MKIAIRSLVLVVAAGVCACSKSETQGTENANPPAENKPVVEPAQPETPMVEAPVVEEPVLAEPAPIPAPVVATGPVATWVFDGQATVAAQLETLEVEMKDAAPEMRDEMRTLMKAMFSSMQMELTLAADNTLTGFNQQQFSADSQAARTAMTGTWSLDGDTLTVNTVEAETQTTVSVSGTLAGDTFSALMTNGPMPVTMIFKRKS